MPALAIPLDGRITSQNILTGPLDGTAVIYIVSPGNAANGNSYQVSLNTLATFFGSFGTPIVITAGATYNSVATDTRILIDLTAAGALSIVMLASTSYSQPVLIKDVKGNVDPTHIATITFSGGELADGQASIPLQTAYAGVWLNPLPASVGGGFYITAA